MPCSITLNGLAYDCTPSVGGIKEVYLHEGFDAAMFTVSGGVVTAITASTGWKKYEFRRGSGSMTSTYTIDEANGVNYCETDLNLVFAKQDTAKRIEIAALAVGQVQAVVVDCNNEYHVLGINEGVVASAAGAETGTARADGNKYTLTLKDYAAELPLHSTVLPTVA